MARIPIINKKNSLPPGVPWHLRRHSAELRQSAGAFRGSAAQPKTLEGLEQKQFWEKNMNRKSMTTKAVSEPYKLA